METKFKIGDNIKIVNHKNIKKIGLLGEVTEVVPVFKSYKEAEESGYIGKFSVGENTSALYRISIGQKILNGYGMEADLELIKN